MGREVRRVPLDFDWPINIPYSGYLRPDDLSPITCPTCGGDGRSPEALVLHQKWWGYVPFSPEDTGSEPYTANEPAILEYARHKIMDSRAFYDSYLGSTGEETARREAARLCDIWNGMWRHHLSQEDIDALLDTDNGAEGLTHRFCYDTRKWLRIRDDRPTQREVNLWTLNLGKGFPLSVPEYAIHVAAAARLGVSLSCSACGGEGETFRDEDHRRSFDEWLPTPPPEGPGWQMWETISEGSPITPPCPSPESLARLLAHEDRVRDDGMGYEGWLKFILGTGWSPTSVQSGGTLAPGHAIAQHH